MEIDITKVDDSTYKVTTTKPPITDTKKIKPRHVQGSVYIDPASPKYLTDIALLVDKDDFLKDIQRLREKWQITNIIEFQLGDQQLLDGWIASHLSKHYKDKKTETLRDELDADIVALRLKYGRTSNYDEVIKWVIFTNTVPSGVFKACYFTTIPQTDSADPSQCQYAIILDGRTENDEVLAALRDFREHLDHLESVQELKKLPVSNSYESVLSDLIIGRSKGPIGKTTDRNKVRTLNNILLVRELYWERKLKKTSFAKLASDAWEKCSGHSSDSERCFYCNADEVSVRKNIENYDKTINGK